MINNTYYNELSKLITMNDEELNNTAKQYKAGDKKALDKMITANLKLVVHYAKKYKKIIQSSDLFELGDLISEGNIGLIQACEKYDPTLNIKFSYYASFWIKKFIQEFIFLNQNIIKSPEQKLIADNKIRKEVDRLFQLNEYEVTPNDINNLEMFYPSEVNHYFNKASIKRIDETTNITDLTIDDDNDKLTIIKNLLHQLTPIENKVMVMQFGIDNQQIFSTKEIGEVLGLSNQRVYQIKWDAILKIKELLRV